MPRSADLAELFGRPPQNLTTLPWDVVEHRLGFGFPSDFKDLASTFGSGVFHHFVFMLAPAQNESTFSSFCREMDEVMEIAGRKEGLPYELFPARGGLIPWAYAGDACTVFWRTDRGRPDEWTIVYCDDDFSRWDEFDGNASGFLLELFSGRVRSEILQFEPDERLTFYAQPGKSDV